MARPTFCTTRCAWSPTAFGSRDQCALRRAARATPCRARRVSCEGRQSDTPTGLTSAFLATLVVLAVGWPAESQAAVHQIHHQPEAFQLATGEGDFWVNVSRYGRYFITVLLGTAYISVKPILQLLKRPKTAVAVIIGAAALYLFVSTTVQAMLGVSNPLDYQPSGFFPENY